MHHISIKLVLITLTGLFLTGCKQAPCLTNEEIIKETKVCRDGGLKVTAVHSWNEIDGDRGIVKIICEPN